MGDALFLKHEEGPVFEVIHEHQARKGPTKVASTAFRNGWEGVFGKKTAIGEA
jgi:hypothetical protein